jgi:D-glycero-D-manno-heptose 1,7-bisphosphate phosphatase
MQKAVFLDRDGVINVDHAYVHKPEDFEFIDGVFEACQAFQAKGYKLIVVTNQSGIGRGYYDEAQFQQLTSWMCEQFSARQITISGVYFCPHHPEKAQAEYLKDCDCRKPFPGMLLQAAQEHQLDVAHSIMIGDKGSDMDAAIAAGVPIRILVKSGQSFSTSCMAKATHVIDSLADAPALVNG